MELNVTVVIIRSKLHKTKSHAINVKLASNILMIARFAVVALEKLALRDARRRHMTVVASQRLENAKNALTVGVSQPI